MVRFLLPISAFPSDFIVSIILLLNMIGFGATESTFEVFSVILASTLYIYFSYQILKRKFRINKSIEYISFVLIILGMMQALGYFYSITPNSLQLALFVVQSIPCILIAALALNLEDGALANSFFVIGVYYSVIIFISIFQTLMVSEPLSIGIYGYQGTSYFIASTVVLLFSAVHVHLLQPKSFSTWKLTAWFVVLLIFLAASVVSGGRGGALVITVLGLMSIFILARAIDATKIASALLPIAILFTGIVLFASTKLDFAFIAQNLDRIFVVLAYLNSNDVAMSAASAGRDEVWAEAVRIITEEPLFGLTPFAAWELGIHPHNIILDIILQFGLIIGSVCLLFLIMIMIIGHRRLTMISILTPVVIYLGVRLNFSSGYLSTALFWFYLTFLLHSAAKRGSA